MTDTTTTLRTGHSGDPDRRRRPRLIVSDMDGTFLSPDGTASARNLAAMADNLPAGGSHWGVIGIGREQWTMVAAALTLGGSIRVGLEDNFYLPDGAMARSNGDLIAVARRLTEELGRRPATVGEARTLLGIRTHEPAA